MSSYYTAAELEAMRREQIRQQIRRELEAGVQRIREQLQNGQTGSVELTGSPYIRVTAANEDAGVSGVHSAGRVNRASFEHGSTGSEAAVSGAAGSEREVQPGPDLSSLLAEAGKKPGRLRQELDEWIRRAEERAVITERDEQEKHRLIGKIEEILTNDEIDIEDQIRFVKMRVTSFLQGGTPMTPQEQARQQAVRVEYAALCEMLEILPAETVFYRVEQEVKRLKERILARRQEEYIMEVIGDLMEELGCQVKDEAVLDHVPGTVFSVEGQPLCDVFVGNDGSGIMFEPVAEKTNVSLDRKRQIENSANHVCSLYAQLEERAAERGVILRRVYLEPAQAETICDQSLLQERRAVSGQERRADQKTREADTKRQARAKKQRAREMEG